MGPEINLFVVLVFLMLAIVTKHEVFLGAALGWLIGYGIYLAIS